MSRRFDPTRRTPDGLAVVDVDPNSKTYSTILSTVVMPNPGDELHHFGWNACSSCLCPNSPHAHAERRYLVVPGLRSSRIHILDTKPDPRNPKIVRVIEPARWPSALAIRVLIRSTAAPRAFTWPLSPTLRARRPAACS